MYTKNEKKGKTNLVKSQIRSTNQITGRITIKSYWITKYNGKNNLQKTGQGLNKLYGPKITLKIFYTTTDENNKKTFNPKILSELVLNLTRSVL